MISINQIFFSEDSDKHDDRNETTIDRVIIRAKSQSIKMRNAFYSDLSWRIQTVLPKKKIMYRHKNFCTTTFTNESWILIEKFMKYAMEVCSVSHTYTNGTSVASATRILKQCWEHDYEDYLWGEKGREPTVVWRQDACVLDKVNATQLQFYYCNSCVCSLLFSCGSGLEYDRH